MSRCDMSMDDDGRTSFGFNKVGIVEERWEGGGGGEEVPGMREEVEGPGAVDWSLSLSPSSLNTVMLFLLGSISLYHSW